MEVLAEKKERERVMRAQIRALRFKVRTGLRTRPYGRPFPSEPQLKQETA